ncbi:hypothetical protein FQU23_001240 [Flavobacterium sp. XN-5]|uniref:hypothetical protein n=1 Tax=Flavobacterium sp. XN-5 TaxID=2599390 RepID=UPI0013EF26B4|nr:hypothetical protein [Flavobacterium sp. XN-5]NGY36132.1 hypothetical protein [Flavobacterium sp. XN-5]
MSDEDLTMFLVFISNVGSNISVELFGWTESSMTYFSDGIFSSENICRSLIDLEIEL